ncbi:hypothetical protein Droror1_Dr00001540 [Drosera rotundifolia]
MSNREKEEDNGKITVCSNKKCTISRLRLNDQRLLHETMSMSPLMSETEMESGVHPEDMIIEMLVRVNYSDLIGFMCILKAWYALINEPGFKEIHPLVTAFLGRNYRVWGERKYMV